MSTDNDTADTLMLEEAQLLAHIENDIIPCANCDTEINVDESYRWINRLVCADCIAEYDGLTADDENNYDSEYEEGENE